MHAAGDRQSDTVAGAPAVGGVAGQRTQVYSAGYSAMQEVCTGRLRLGTCQVVTTSK
jgi:hypothetical protein